MADCATCQGAEYFMGSLFCCICPDMPPMNTSSGDRDCDVYIAEEGLATMDPYSAGR